MMLYRLISYLKNYINGFMCSPFLSSDQEPNFKYYLLKVWWTPNLVASGHDFRNPTICAAKRNAVLGEIHSFINISNLRSIHQTSSHF